MGYCQQGPYKWKTLYRKSRNLSDKKPKMKLPKYVMSRAIDVIFCLNGCIYRENWKKSVHVLLLKLKCKQENLGTAKTCKWFVCIGHSDRIGTV